MYNERLEQLIDAALADGELTEKEKQILFKKAQEMGVDLDEFEMVLDGRLVKLKKAEEEKAKSSAPKSNKLGDVKKCPNCGAIVQSYQGVCGECGYAFENIEANAVVSELSSLLRKSNNSKKMADIIDTYPIPMDKGALIAFITWLRPQSFDFNNPLAESYSKKYDECISKARLAFSTDKDFIPLIEQYEKDKKDMQRKKLLSNTKKRLTAKRFWIGIVIVIIIGGIIAINYSQKQKALREDPDVLYNEVKSLLENNEIDSAEKLVRDFADYNSWIGTESESAYSACNDILTTYISNNQIEKAIELYKYVTTKSFMYDICVWQKLSALRLYYIENRQYNEGMKYIPDEEYFDMQYLTDYIMALINSGEEETARNFFNKNKKRYDLTVYNQRNDYNRISQLLSVK